MKRTLSIIAASIICLNSFASTGKDFPLLEASQVLLPIGKSGQTISLLELSRIKPTQLQLLTGKKMNLFEKIAFKAAQKRLRNHIQTNGTLDKKMIRRWERFYGIKDDHTKKFHAGGFFLGFLLGLIGVLIAYLINDEHKRNRIKWAWIGLAGQIVLSIILVAADVILLRLN